MNPSAHLQRLRALLADAGREGARNEVPAVTIDGQVAKLRLYDPVDDWGGWWGVSAKEFVKALDQLPDDVAEIQLLINSPGGFVHEATAIMNALRRHPAKVVAIVEGLAASAASFIAASADELVMARNSELMIHDVWMVAVGNANDLREAADHTDRLSNTIASVYAARAGGTVDEWRDRMRAETWLTDQEAVDIGLADRIDEGTAAASNRFDLSVFRYPGRASAPAPKIKAADSDTDEGGDPPAASSSPAPDPTTPPADSTAAGDEIADPASGADDAELQDSDALELLNL